MADLKEVKSRIRIKRGPKTKMSGVTLPKGTPFYNETDNTLLISDGVTELNKHPIITTNSIHTDNWTIEEVTDPTRGLNALKIQKNNNVPIYIINDGGGYPADATVISPEYLRANEVVIGSKSLSINQDNKLRIDGADIVTKLLVFDASLIGKSTGGTVVESTGRSYVKIPHTTSGGLKINIRELNIPLLEPTMKLQFNFSWRK